MNRRGFSRRRRMTIAAAFLGTALAAVPASAQNATWNGATGDFGASSNWTPAVVPTGRATFANTGQTDVTITLDTTLSEIVFAPNAQFYTITNLGNLTITSGISTPSGISVTIRNDGGSINFTGTALVQSGTGFISIFNQLGNVTFTDQSGMDDQASLSTSGLAALAGAGVTVVPPGDSSSSFQDSSFADDASLGVFGGSATATGAGANVTGGNAFLSFAGSSHADGATFLVGNAPGSAGSSLAGAGGVATANGGSATLTFTDDSHADDATFINFSGPAGALGGAGAAGTGAAGTAVISQGGFGLTVFNDNSHADRALINNIGGATGVGGGLGAAGGAGNGGAGGAATGNAGAATFIFNGNSHADGATINNRADPSFAAGGTGGAGGIAGAGGAGGNARASSDDTSIVLNDNAHVSGAAIFNRGGIGSASGGVGGAGSASTAGVGGGAAGTATATGSNATITLNGNATLGTGTTIDNRGGDSLATGGRGGLGDLGQGGSGGNATATGGDGMLVFNDHSSAGDAVITNQSGGARGFGGIGGNGTAADGGSGGFGAATAGRGIIDFNDNATAGSATITNAVAVAISSATAGTNGTGGAGGLAGGASSTVLRPVIRFNDNATGGSVHIVNTAVGDVFFNGHSIFGTAAPGATIALIDNAAGGLVGFNDSASLGNGAIVNNGLVTFEDSSTAGTGTIANTAVVTFAGNSSAGTATINNSATLNFLDTSDAVAARLVNGATGQVNVGVNGLRLGSLTGGGTVLLGSNALQTGYLDLADSFSGVISGAGALVKRGTGTLTLTGDNTYLGGTTIAAGTLQIGNGGTTGSITGDVVNNANLTFNRSDIVGFAGAISGTGSLTKIGAGTLVLTGANTYSGVTTITSGVLQIGNAGTTGSIAGNIVDNSFLVFNRSDSLTYGGNISGAGQLTKLGAGTLTLTGDTTLSGITLVSNGVLQIGNGGTTGSLSGNILNNANVTFNRSDTITYGGVMSGAGGSLTKIGTGTLILTATNTYTGATLVNAGTLQLMGSIASPTTIGAAGTLRGTGTVNGALTANGVVNPGTAAAPLGTLVVTGNAAFNAGSFLAPTINSVGGSSLLQAGSLTLNGGQVRPTAQPGGLFLMQTDFRVATGTAGRTGTFTGVDESQLPAFLDATLNYVGNDVFLRVRRNASNFAQAPNLTPNQSAVSTALDAAVTAGNPLVFTTYLATYNTLLGLNTNGQLQGALNVLSGDALTALPVAAQEHANRFAQRLDSYTWSNSSNIWGLIAYGDQDADGDGNGPGFRANGLEFQIGFNTSLGADTRLGLSAGYNDGDVDSDDRLASADIETWSLGAQLRHDFGPAYVSGQLTYSGHSIKSSRALLLAGAATADYDATTWTAGGEIGGVIRTGHVAIEPHVSLRYANTDQDAFSEAGPAGALAVAAADYETARLGLGVRLANREPAAPVRFHALVRYEHELGDERAALDNALPGLPAFRVVGTHLGDDIVTGEVGAEFRLSQGLSLFAAAGGHARSNETSVTANAGLRIVF
jgi:autotransporter-associated beta strand protein